MLILIQTVTKWFKEGNIMVAGERGKGKDVLFGNVINRIKRPYISNTDYTKDDRFIPLNFKDLDCGGNTHRNFLTGKLNYYEFPYPDETNVYISDAGIYLPCQYNEELDREIGELAVFAALSRHLAKGQFHINSQAIERPWNKLREQAEKKYIVCTRCIVLFGIIVFGQFTLYERYQSAVDCVPVFPLKEPLFKKKSDKINIELEKAKYQISHGKIKPYTYICINKSKHDSRAFKTMLANGDNSMKYTAEYFEENGILRPPKKKKKKEGANVGTNSLPF